MYFRVYLMPGYCQRVYLSILNSGSFRQFSLKHPEESIKESFYQFFVCNYYYSALRRRKGQQYGNVIKFIRKIIRFCMLMTILESLRVHDWYGEIYAADLDYNLIDFDLYSSISRVFARQYQINFLTKH